MHQTKIISHRRQNYEHARHRVPRTSTKSFAGVGRGLLSLMLAISALAGGLFTPSMAHADPLPIVNLYYGSLTEDLELTADNVYVVNGTVAVPDGITVNIEAGTIIKNASWYGAAFEVTSGGTLNANGTSMARVTFTSYKDDSKGGDSNGDGNSSGTPGDYQAAVNVVGAGNADIKFTEEKYAQWAISVSCDANTNFDMADTIVDSTVNVSSCGQGRYSLKRNTINAGSNFAINTYASDLTGIVLDGTDKNTTTDSGKGAVISATNSSYVSAGSTWNVSGLSNFVLMPSTMTVDGTFNAKDGLIVKAPTNEAYSTSKIAVSSTGIMNTTGSSSKRVIFTSDKDDSVGGDSNGDGASSGAVQEYGTSIIVSAEASASLNYASFKYGGYSVVVQCGGPSNTSFALTDSLVFSTVQIQSCNAGEVSLQRNNFAVSSGYAVDAMGSDVSGVDLSGSNQNLGTGSDKGVVVYVQQFSRIDQGEQWQISGGNGIVVLIETLQVYGDLAADNGAIIKQIDFNYYMGITIEANGATHINGTANNPVILTSYKDDSVGGDSYGDGQSSRSPVDYTSTLGFSQGATVEISHAEIRSAQSALEGSCSGGTNVSVEDSKLKSEVRIFDCGQDTLSFKRNQFSSEHENAMEIWNSELSGIVLSGSDKNIAVGSSGRGTTISSRQANSVAQGKTWHVAGDSGLTLENDNLNVYGNLILEEGAVLKGVGVNILPLHVHENGTIYATGTSTNPVIITSATDDSVRGDTDGNGVSVGDDYRQAYGLAVAGNSIAELNHVEIKHAGTAISLYGGGYNFKNMTISNSDTGIDVNDAVVVYRGKFSGIDGRAIKACNWQSQSPCAVDAAYVDWGSVDGPFASNPADNLACGVVSVLPWRLGSTPYQQGALFSDIKNCSDVYTLADSIYGPAEQYETIVQPYEVDCGYLIQDACDTRDTYYQCFNSGIDVAIQFYNLPISNPNSTAGHATFMDQLMGEVTTLLINKTSEEVLGSNQSRQSIGFTDAYYIYNQIGTSYNNCLQP